MDQLAHPHPRTSSKLGLPVTLVCYLVPLTFNTAVSDCVPATLDAVQVNSPECLYRGEYFAKNSEEKKQFEQKIEKFGNLSSDGN